MSPAVLYYKGLEVMYWKVNVNCVSWFSKNGIHPQRGKNTAVSLFLLNSKAMRYYMVFKCYFAM